jgi:nucleotide-binding universal stress UspA family protein
MFHALVLAFDGSQESHKAAKLAEALATRFGSEVLVLHIKEIYHSGVATWSPEWSPELEAQMDQVVKDMEAGGIKARVAVQDAPHGHAGKAIADVASEEKADLIVMGSTGRSRLAGLILGSVSNRVLHFATCPVLIAR